MLEIGPLDWHSLNVWVHVSAGVTALVIGVVPLIAPKGNWLHRTAGQAFAGAMAAVLLTAVIGNIFFYAPAPLVAASLSAGYLYLSSLRALSLKGRHPGSLDIALAMAGLAGAAALALQVQRGTASWTPALGYSIVGSVVALAVYDLSRHLWPDAWSKHARPIDHGLKMTGAYFAMMSAGLGNVFRDLQPVSQVGPILLGTMLQLGFLVAYVMGRGRKGNRE